MVFADKDSAGRSNGPLYPIRIKIPVDLFRFMGGHRSP